MRRADKVARRDSLITETVDCFDKTAHLLFYCIFTL